MAEVAEPGATGSNRRVQIVIAIVVLIIGYLIIRSTMKKRVIADLASSDPAARKRSAQTLMDSKTLTDTLSRQTVPVKRPMIATLREMNTADTAGQLIALMKDRNPTIQNLAQFALQDMQPTSVEKLVAALGDADLNVKNRAAAALIRIGQPALAPVTKDGKQSVPLIDAISNGGARAGVTRVVSAISVGAAPWLIQKLSDEKADAATKACAIDILGRINAREAAAQIREMLNAEKVDPPVRAAALVALARLRHPDAFGLLQTALSEDAPAVKNTAIVGLGELRDARAVALLQNYLFGYDESLRDVAVASLTKIGAPAIPALAALLKNERYEVRLGSLRALEGIADNRVPALIASALKDQNENVRIKAAEALATSGNASTVAALTGALADSEWRVASKASESLAIIGKPAIPGLVALLGKDAKSLPAFYAQEALEKMGEPAVPALVSTAQAANVAACQRAVIALGGICDNRALGVLENLAKNGTATVRPLAERALKQVREGRRVS